MSWRAVSAVAAAASPGGVPHQQAKITKLRVISGRALLCGSTRHRLGRRFVGDGGDAGETVRLPQGEQVLGFGGEGAHPRRGPRLAAEDAVVVAPWADLRALRRVGGP